MRLSSHHSSIYVAGHSGLVGSAVVRCLTEAGYDNLITRTHAELDLTSQGAVSAFFEETEPEYVVLAAARVGGILANNRFPVDFLVDNLQIQTNVLQSAAEAGVHRLLFLGSSCIYPKLAPQPLKEEYLLTAPLEPTNQWYAVAKIAGVKMCEAYKNQYGLDFISLMPTNLYGPHDNFDLETSHVLPALLRKFHTAQVNGESVVEIWGSGKPRREFMYTEDLADACKFVLETETELLDHVAPDTMLNVGVGEDISISELAMMIRKTVGVDCNLTYDADKPDGTPQKLLDVSRMHSLGWKARTSLPEGLRKTYEWYLNSRWAN